MLLPYFYISYRCLLQVAIYFIECFMLFTFTHFRTHRLVPPNRSKKFTFCGSCDGGIALYIPFVVGWFVSASGWNGNGGKLPPPCFPCSWYLKCVLPVSVNHTSFNLVVPLASTGTIAITNTISIMMIVASPPGVGKLENQLTAGAATILVLFKPRSVSNRTRCCSLASCNCASLLALSNAACCSAVTLRFSFVWRALYRITSSWLRVTPLSLFCIRAISVALIPFDAVNLAGGCPGGTAGGELALRLLNAAICCALA